MALRASLEARASALEARLGVLQSNSSLPPPPRAPAFLRALQRLLRGYPLRLLVVGGSAAAGAGGVGYNGTFDALLVRRLNALIERAEQASPRPLGRVVRLNVAQGGTTSFWAAMMAEALGRGHVMVWEYAINDHAVSLEAAGKHAVRSLLTSSRAPCCGGRGLFP